jgi:DNA-binding MarR family transcriptional regulator
MTNSAQLENLKGMVTGSMNEMDSAKQLRECVRLLERKLGMLESDYMACCGVTMAQCHALIEIGRAKRIALNELAGIMNLENSSMSRTVKNLVSRELVTRETDPSDRRYVTIQLTESGQQLFQSIEADMNAYYEKIYLGLSAEKRLQVIESLNLLVHEMRVD